MWTFQKIPALKSIGQFAFIIVSPVLLYVLFILYIFIFFYIMYLQIYCQYSTIIIKSNIYLSNCSALTRHLTPPITSATSTSEVEVSDIESVQALVNTQNEQILRLLNVVQEISPQLLGTDALKNSKGTVRMHSKIHI